VRFRDWPPSRIVLLSLAWVLLSMGAFVWWILRELDKFSAQTKSSTGAVAISGGIAETLAPILGPPLLFLVSWIAARRLARP
jgi:hypothetical protein